MSKPSDVEVRATTFVKDNRDLLETAGPLTLQTIVRAGSLMAVELCDEVVVAAEAYEKALYEGSDALVGSDGGKGVSPRRVAAVESRIPTLKATYERKSRAFEELSNLTDRAIERYEARTDDQVEDDEWSHENIAKWLERDRIAPELDECQPPTIPKDAVTGVPGFALGSPTTTDNEDGTFAHTWELEPGLVNASTPVSKEDAEPVCKGSWWKRLFGRSDG